MVLEELRNIGLTEGEIRIYEALLVLGESTKTAIAKQSGISPSNIYDVTNRLIEKGFVSRVEKNNVAHFSVVSPTHIKDFIKQKRDEIDKEEKIVENLLPNLLLRFNKTREKSDVEVFYGKEGMKRVFDDLISECNKNDENFVLGASQGEGEDYYDNFFLKYSILRAEKGIKTKILFDKAVLNRKERISFFKKSSNYKIKFLDQTGLAETMLYKNTSCILILTKEPMVIRIRSKEVFDSFKQQFDSLWLTAK